MFEANTALQVSETDFNGLKDSFKEFVRTKTEFTDYNLDGPVISQVLDILAYHSYMNSFYTNMAVNENFQDTAQLRPNVVSNAKKLGYLPSSARCAKATLQVRFVPNDSPAVILIPKGTKFRATRDYVTYTFQTLQEYAVTPSAGQYVASIDVYEGELLEQTFTYDPSRIYYEILNSNVDLDSLRVVVQENANDTETRALSRVIDITELTAETDAYYLQENHRERYEMYFGDGVLGRQLETGNIVRLSYLVSSGSSANDIRRFDATGYIGRNGANTVSYAPSVIATTSPAYYGSEREGIESIRFNAKHFYNIQNRFVTKNDYLHFLKNKYPFIQSVQVWGGEEHIPPVYGKVIISIKPKDGYSLSDHIQDEIVKELKSRNVLTIEPLFVDPIYLYISPTINVTFDSSKTTLDRDGLFAKIQTAIQAFEETKISDFGEFFQYSTFVNMVDTLDNSLISSETSLLLEKRFVPIIDSNLSYRLQFHNNLRNPYSGYKGCLTSTTFKTNTSDQTLAFDDDGMGHVRIFYRNDSNEKVYLNNSAGTINYNTGDISIKGIRFTQFAGDEIKFFAQPAGTNFYPVRNQILMLSHPTLNLFDINTNQLIRSDILDVNGNISLINSSAIDIPVVF